MLEVPFWIVGSVSLVYIYFEWVEPCPDTEILLTMIANTRRQIRSCVLLYISFVLVSSFLLFCCVWSLKACSENVVQVWSLMFMDVNFKGCCWEEKKEKKTTSKTVWCWCYQVILFLLILNLFMARFCSFVPSSLLLLGGGGGRGIIVPVILSKIESWTK